MSKPEEGYVFLAAIETALREQDWIPAECGERGHWVNPGVAIAEDDRCGWSTEEAVGIQVEHEREQIERYDRYEDDEPESLTTASKNTPVEQAGTTERYTIIDGTRYDLPEDYSLIATDQIDSLREYQTLIRDLSRSAQGRCLGDVEDGAPDGFSQGNPILPVGTHIGYSLYGAHRIVVPETRHGFSKPADWYVKAEDQ